MCQCIVLVLLLAAAATLVGAFDSGEFYHSHFGNYHSEEADDFVSPKRSKPANYKCFGYHNYPVLNNYPIRPRPAGPAPLLDDLDPLFMARTPKGRDRYYDTTFDDDFDISMEVPIRKKVPFDVCYEMCPASKEEKLVCGDDGKTYTNIHKLNCAVRCGVGNVKTLLWIEKKIKLVFGVINNATISNSF